MDLMIQMMVMTMLMIHNTRRECFGGVYAFRSIDDVTPFDVSLCVGWMILYCAMITLVQLLLSFFSFFPFFSVFTITRYFLCCLYIECV